MDSLDDGLYVSIDDEKRRKRIRKQRCKTFCAILSILLGITLLVLTIVIIVKNKEHETENKMKSFWSSVESTFDHLFPSDDTSRLYLHAIWVLFAIILLIFIFYTIKGCYYYFSKRPEIRRLSTKVSKIKTEMADTQNEIKNLEKYRLDGPSSKGKSSEYTKRMRKVYERSKEFGDILITIPKNNEKKDMNDDGFGLDIQFGTAFGAPAPAGGKRGKKDRKRHKNRDNYNGVAPQGEGEGDMEEDDSFSDDSDVLVFGNDEDDKKEKKNDIVDFGGGLDDSLDIIGGGGGLHNENLDLMHSMKSQSDFFVTASDLLNDLVENSEYYGEDGLRYVKLDECPNIEVCDDLCYYLIVNELRHNCQLLQLLLLAYDYQIESLFDDCIDELLRQISSNSMGIKMFIQTVCLFERIGITKGFNKIKKFGKQNKNQIENSQFKDHLPVSFLCGVLKS